MFWVKIISPVGTPCWQILSKLSLNLTVPSSRCVFARGGFWLSLFWIILAARVRFRLKKNYRFALFFDELEAKIGYLELFFAVFRDVERFVVVHSNSSLIIYGHWVLLLRLTTKSWLPRTKHDTGNHTLVSLFGVPVLLSSQFTQMRFHAGIIQPTPDNDEFHTKPQYPATGNFVFRLFVTSA